MSNKVVFITGTNSGFGYLTAVSAARAGHKVWATMRNANGKNAEKKKKYSHFQHCIFNL